MKGTHPPLSKALLMKRGLAGIALSLVLNLLAWVFHLDYLWTVLLVMGGMSLWLVLNAKEVTRQQWIVLAIFGLISNGMTFVIEKLMLYYDVWGFSHREFRLIGVTLSGAPIEEFVYWFFCPWLAALAYLVLGRSSSPEVQLPAGAVLEAATVAGKLSEAAQEKEQDVKQDVSYVEDDPKAVVEGVGKYSRGVVAARYFWLQAIIIAAILAMVRYYRGNWKSLAWSVALFVSIAYPNELLGLHNGFWTYNVNRLLGPWFLGVPIEEWLMYTISPTCGCMMLDLMDRALFRKDV
jgi:lycopene cyclase domain-containing protein